MVIVAQLSGGGYNILGGVHFKRVNLMISELYLNKNISRLLIIHDAYRKIKERNIMNY